MVLMLKFNPADPFPLLRDGAYSCVQEQLHAQDVDAWLGLRVESIETLLAVHGSRLRAPAASGEKQQLWFGLDTKSLLTPYTEIRRMLARLNLRTGMTVVDLGAGYGRMGFVIARHHPGVRFIGYEYVGERVKSGHDAFTKLGYVTGGAARMEHADLASSGFMPAAADLYFIYDYGTPKAIEKTLYDLRRVAARQPITLVGRGRNCRYAIESRHSWLAPMFPSEGETRATIYRSSLALVPTIVKETGSDAGL